MHEFIASHQFLHPHCKPVGETLTGPHDIGSPQPDLWCSRLVEQVELWLGWLDKWFDEANWPRDPRLDVFRDSVLDLTIEGEIKGWLTTSVGVMRS